MTDAAAGRIVAWLLRSLRRFDPDRLADFLGGAMRRIGPWLPEHRTGTANLKAAFPEKPAAEVEAILRGSWDNLGRVAAEYVHLDRLWSVDTSRPEAGRVDYPPECRAIVARAIADGQPKLVFGAHLANWELCAVAATAIGLPLEVLYRRPNNEQVAAAIADIRAGSMGKLVQSDYTAAYRLATTLRDGRYVGMLVDQHFGQGVETVFFGRKCRTNPLIARLARQFDCAVHGARIIRLPGRRFRVEATEALDLPRDADGRIDIAGAMQAITSVVEAWVREHPEQWLWQHRRWR
jgi:KDO2-lipid IV(A) lauroyltransferase